MKVHRLFPLNNFQDRLTAGRLPETEANRLPEGELILTINIYFPSTVEKVSIYLYLVTFIPEWFVCVADISLLRRPRRVNKPH